MKRVIWGMAVLLVSVLASGCNHVVTSSNDPTVLTFLPAVRVGGVWHGGGRDGQCTGLFVPVVCPAGPGITVTLDTVGESDETKFRVAVTLAEPATVEALAIERTVVGTGAKAWLSNGFQSWSQSGALAIGPEPSEADTEAALAAFGDVETIRSGAELSWWYTVVGGGNWTILAAVLKPESQKAWAQVWRSPGEEDTVHLRLVSGGVGPQIIAPAGSTIVGESWFLSEGKLEQSQIDSMGTKLWQGSRSVQSRLLGWNSWYEFWDSTDEKHARANFGLAKTALDPLTAPAGRWLVIDDSWQNAWGDWTPNGKFPSGLDNLAKDVKAQGWHFGVWLAPFLVSAKLPLVTQHPDWFLPGVSYLHLKNGEMKILDVTNPNAAAHLTGVIEQLATWGCEILKIDFLFAGLYEAPRFDGKSTPVQSYRAALQLIRDVANKHGIRLVAVGAPPVPTLEYADGWRSGTDIAVENFGPSWPFLPNQLRAFAARIPYCQVIACDVDPPILRTLPSNEVDFGLWTVAFAAGGFFLSDNLEVLSPDRLAQGLVAKRVNLALGGQLSLPQSIFPDNPPATLSSAIFDQISLTTTQIVPQVWNTPDGQRVLMNASDVTATIAGEQVPPHSARAL